MQMSVRSDTLAAFVVPSPKLPLVHFNMSLRLPSNLPTHLCISASVCMPVTFYESPLS